MNRIDRRHAGTFTGAVEMSEKKQEARLVEVTLAKPHKHAGEEKATGEKIKVTEPERDWLASRGIINNAPTAQEGAK